MIRATVNAILKQILYYVLNSTYSADQNHNSHPRTGGQNSINRFCICLFTCSVPIFEVFLAGLSSKFEQPRNVLLYSVTLKAKNTKFCIHGNSFLSQTTELDILEKSNHEIGYPQEYRCLQY